MNVILRSSLPLLLSLLASTAVAQEVVEAGGQRTEVKALAAQAEKAFKTQDWKTAATAYAKLVEARPDDALAWHHLGYALHADGHLDEALKAHIKAASFGDKGATGAYNAACVLALKGQNDKAFAWLEKARSKGFENRSQVKIDKDLVGLHDDPRFAKFVESLPKADAKAGVQVYVANTTRSGSRLLFWSQSAGSPGQIAVDHGQPVWKPGYAKAIESGKLDGRRWRLGQDFWTTFDTNLNVRVGEVELAPGAYYLTLEKTTDGAFVLAFNDPAAIRAKHIDPTFAHLTSGGIEVEMLHKTTGKIAEALTISVATKKGDIQHGRLTIHFGPHLLTVPFEVQLDL